MKDSPTEIVDGRERETLSSAAFENLPVPVLVVDDARVCMAANTVARELWGDADEDGLVEGQKLTDLFFEVSTSFDRMWEEMLDGGKARLRVGVKRSNAEQSRWMCVLEGHTAAGNHLVTLQRTEGDDASREDSGHNRQKAIGELGRFALMDSTPADISQHSVEVVGPHLEMETCAFYPAVDGHLALDPDAVWKVREQGPEAVRVSGDEALAFRGAVPTLGEPVIVEDVLELEPGAVRDVLERSGARSAILAGVGSADERFGLIVGASSRRGDIDESRREFLELVSRILGQALASKVNLERLEESRSRLQLAMRLGRLAQFDWDVPSGVIEFDHQMARNLGLEPAEIAETAEASFEWVYEHDKDEVREAIQPVIDGEKDEYEVYARIRGLNREWRWQLSRGRAVERDDDGRAIRILGFQQDVHERVSSEISRAELEEQLRQSRKMEALGRLAGGIAHDFNNLLTAITGYAELAYQEVEDPELRQDIHEILVASNRAERLTSRLLSLSRRKQLRSAVSDINAIIVEFEKMLDRILGEEVIFSVDLDSSLWRVEIDRSSVEQVLLNLVVNARDAMPMGGELRVETRNVELLPGEVERSPELSAGDYVRLTVSDTGVGMDPRTLERAVEPFFTTKDVGEGTGLGLATVYGVARQAGGSLTIESVEGEGTTIELFLPRSHQELTEVELEPISEVVDGATEAKILVAEDDEVLLNLVVRVLRERGFDVTAFENPRAASTWLEQEGSQIDLLLTDVVMPEMRGTELAARAIEVFPEVTVLFMSGYTADAEFSSWTRGPNVSLLRKPFTPSQLVGRVKDVLSGWQGRMAPEE
ncbi:MAG: ATP-binding protein [Myxococcota bacterium]